MASKWPLDSCRRTISTEFARLEQYGPLILITLFLLPFFTGTFLLFEIMEPIIKVWRSYSPESRETSLLIEEKRRCLSARCIVSRQFLTALRPKVESDERIDAKRTSWASGCGHCLSP